MSTNTTQVTAQDALAALDNFSAVMRAFLTGGEATPPVETVTKTAAKTVAKAPAGKVYRSKPGKEAAKAQVAALYEADRVKYGVKRWSDIPAKAQAATKAECKAIWAAVPKTRTTKG